MMNDCCHAQTECCCWRHHLFTSTLSCHHLLPSTLSHHAMPVLGACSTMKVYSALDMFFVTLCVYVYVRMYNLYMYSAHITVAISIYVDVCTYGLPCAVASRNPQLGTLSPASLGDFLISFKFWTIFRFSE